MGAKEPLTRKDDEVLVRKADHPERRLCPVRLVGVLEDHNHETSRDATAEEALGARCTRDRLDGWSKGAAAALSFLSHPVPAGRIPTRPGRVLPPGVDTR